jgi:mRNA interferase MazF
MGEFARGQVVLVRFPFSDLSKTKLRPALVLAAVEYGDLVLCQITSKTYEDRMVIELTDAAFSDGALPVKSYARPTRLMTASDSLVDRAVATLTEDKRSEVIQMIIDIIK